MKKWNTPEVTELEISKTENGPIKCDIESIPGLPDYAVLGKKQNSPS